MDNMTVGAIAVEGMRRLISRRGGQRHRHGVAAVALPATA